jgi:hypothetical protein
MFSAFPSIGRKAACYSQYPRINEIFDPASAPISYEVHRSLHKLAIDNRIEAAIFDKCNFMGRLENGEWGPFALPYYAMWLNYEGYDYLNNGIYFKEDWDGDGLSNSNEFVLGTNPFNADSDGDHIFDQAEVQNGLNPLDSSDGAADADGDRVSNYDEITSTLKWMYTSMDENGDYPSLDPLDPSDGGRDDDHDLFPVWFELKFGLNISDIHIQKDSRKGAFFWWLDATDIKARLPAMDTFVLELSSSDSDGDGLKNDEELGFGLDPKSASDADEDWDSDGITNRDEVVANTDPAGDFAAPLQFDRQLVRAPVHARQEIADAPLWQSVSAPPVGEKYTFWKLSGSAWLEVKPSGILSGEPRVADEGINSWEIAVSNLVGEVATNTLYIEVLPAFQIPEIKLSGGAVPIQNPSLTPRVENGTKFTPVQLGDYLEQIYSISNAGISELNITNLSLSNPASGFSVRQLPSFSIGKDASSQFILRFTPQNFGSVTTQVQIISNDSKESPYTFAVSGTGLPSMDFVPTQLSGCVLWLDGDDLDADGIAEGLNESSLSNGLVWAWMDKSGVSNQASALALSTAPELIPDAQAERSVLRFDGTDDALFFNTITNIRTAFWVLSESGNVTGYNFLLGDATTYAFHRGEVADGRPIWSRGWSSSYILNGETRLNGTEIDGAEEGLPSDTFSLLSLRTTGPVQAGQLSQDRNMPNRSWYGDVAELILFDRPLSDQEIGYVESYLERKWGITRDPAVSFKKWIRRFAVGSQTNQTDDPDGDGFCNLSEYAFGADPLQSTQRPAALRILSDQGIRIVYSRRRVSKSRMHYRMESCTNLLQSNSWSSNALIRVGIAPDGDNFESVTNLWNHSSSEGYFRVLLETEE